MKTYHVTLIVDVKAKTQKQALNLLGPAAATAMKVARTGVAFTAEEEQ